jgi:methylenetetrahydrofolate dehydrogenase (NADP+)/methenyltetrahydrofolate cyclohydrolase
MDPDYDPDMMTIANRGHLYDGDLTCLPAIVQAVKTIVTDYALNLEGKKCLIVGRSHSVGMPLFQYFLSSNAATTVVHSKVSNEVINAMASEADIIVLASGHPGIIKRTSYRPTQTVIDCGFSAGGGDLGFIPNEGELEAYTPVPGGVGALTSYCLLLNAIALEKRKNLAHY